MNSVQSQELVVLLDDVGRSIGTAPKSEVHHDSTPLHLAFSCYLFDHAGHVLLTRRALDKRRLVLEVRALRRQLEERDLLAARLIQEREEREQPEPRPADAARPPVPGGHWR